MSDSEHIRITEVGPRDGLQNERAVVRVEDKTHNLAVKVSGIAALMSGAGVWLKSQFFGQ